MRLSFSADRKARVAVLISGRGSNMVALADAAARADYPAEIALVLSDSSDAPGLETARARGFAVAGLAGPKRAEREADLAEKLREARIDLVAMAGFLKVLSAEFTEAWRDKILNIHPSLLPSFRGLDTHQRAIDASVRIHGATVHLARAALDDGPILAQAALSVGSDENAMSLGARVLKLEHRIYAPTLADYASGRIWVEGEKVCGVEGAGAALIAR